MTTWSCLGVHPGHTPELPSPSQLEVLTSKMLSRPLQPDTKVPGTRLPLVSISPGPLMGSKQSGRPSGSLLDSYPPPYSLCPGEPELMPLCDPKAQPHPCLYIWAP